VGDADTTRPNDPTFLELPEVARQTRAVTIGRRIAEARKRLDMTQADLARAVDVHVRSIGNWERGAHVPRAKQHLIESVLGIDLNDDIDEQETVALHDVSDAALLNEVARRMSRGRLAVVDPTEPVRFAARERREPRRFDDPGAPESPLGAT
jgi:transcriptional regulator with XRE-family HTH domain